LCSDDPRSGQAASNSIPRRRAGSEISLFQPRPAAKMQLPTLDICRHIYIEGPAQHRDPDKFITQVALLLDEDSATTL